MSHLKTSSSFFVAAAVAVVTMIAPAGAQTLFEGARLITGDGGVIESSRNSAAVLGLDRMGSIAMDKSADFIVLDANPLDSISNTRKINKVFLRGTEVRRAALASKWRVVQ